MVTITVSFLVSTSISRIIIGGQVTTSVTSSELPGTTSTPKPTSYEHPPLTTIFTPDPSCSSFYIDSCADDPPGQICYASAFPYADCLDEDSQETTRSSLACYPGSSRGSYLRTYSPGYFCPVGMTTVHSVTVPSGAWCCLNGLTWSNEVCQKTTSQATLLSIDYSSCAREEVVTVRRQINGGDAIILYAVAILLTGQKFPMTTPFTSTTSSSTASPTSLIPTSNPKDVPSNQGSLSKSANVEIILGSIFGTVSLLLLAAFYIRRHRKAKAARKFQSEQPVKVEPDEYIGKPELEGSKAYVHTVKAELDAAAIRAELEGDIEQPHGDGICVLKPELEGTVGTERNRGVYVRNKSELEAISTSCASTTQHSLADLEAVAPSTGDGPVPLGRLYM
ncbi:hypothetical protein F4782DRAFT_503494 [Xylaria castorea]|nr:hypothetical protein F4782DRAFT_503494 [Xylaria castorea]